MMTYLHLGPFAESHNTVDQETCKEIYWNGVARGEAPGAILVARTDDPILLGVVPEHMGDNPICDCGCGLVTISYIPLSLPTYTILCTMLGTQTPDLGKVAVPVLLILPYYGEMVWDQCERLCRTYALDLVDGTDEE